MSIYSDYSELSDFELYKKAKQILLNELLTQKTSDFKLNKIRKECHSRQKNIIEIAYYSACYTYENIYNVKNKLEVKEKISDIVTELDFYKILESFYYVDGSKLLTQYLSSENIIKPENLLLVKVSGISMIGFGFVEGNYGIADRSLKPKHGNFVIAEVNNQKFIKKLVFENDKYILRSSSPEFPDYIIKDLKSEVIAVVIYQLYGI